MKNWKYLFATIVCSICAAVGFHCWEISSDNVTTAISLAVGIIYTLGALWYNCQFWLSK